MTYAKKSAFFQKPLFLGKANLKGSLETQGRNKKLPARLLLHTSPASPQRMSLERQLLVTSATLLVTSAILKPEPSVPRPAGESLKSPTGGNGSATDERCPENWNTIT